MNQTEAPPRELDGITAPPLRNGELDFEAPWQSRVFVMAQALCEAGLYAWSDFQASLILTINSAPVAPDQPYRYYDHFLKALTNLLRQKGVVVEEEVYALALQLGQLEPGHDHHDHDHDHGPHSH